MDLVLYNLPATIVVDERPRGPNREDLPAPTICRSPEDVQELLQRSFDKFAEELVYLKKLWGTECPKC
jgi:hypothetical protein